MNKTLKKTLGILLSTSMIAASVVLPAATASADDLKSWKFDFGAADQAAQTDYTAVDPTVNYSANTSGGYGFIGTNEMDYTLDGGHIDGFRQQEGQTITLTAGGGEGLLDGIGSTGEDDFSNAGDKFYPVRFALKVPDETYYKVKATVTTLDTSKPATASLYTERKHPLYTEKKIAAGQTVVTEFTVRPTPIFYKGDGAPKADGMVNVCVLGENTALASLEITQLATAPVLWVLGDSTVTDGGGDLPFWPLQNYTGVGTGLTKYLPSTIAMVNEGEGGLNATDSGHFNMAKERIKAGDYMYVEYGHNHKNAHNEGEITAANRGTYHSGEYWRNNYLAELKKYYEACKTPAGNTAAGLSGTATLIIVGPIDRHNAEQYDSETNTWSSTLSGFSELGKRYVDCLLYSGEATAKLFVDKWAEISAKGEQIYEVHKDELLGVANSTDVDALKTELAALEAEADTIYNTAIAGEKNGVSNVAFVDLNKPSLDWMAELTKTTKSTASVDYYFQTAKGGKVDGTHPNDTGAENLAYYFFKTADKTKYPALAPLLTNFAEGVEHEEPTPVSAEVIAAGASGKSSYWPTYTTPVAFAYPLVIKDITLDENNHLETLKVVKQASFSDYAAALVDIYNSDGTKVRQVVTKTHVDNTNSNGTYTLEFDTNDENTILADGETYKAYMWSKDMTDGHIIAEADGGEQLSSVYTATDIDTYLLPGEKTDVETFSYYGKSSLKDVSAYRFGGSTGGTFTLGTDSTGVTYTTVEAAGNGSSYFLIRALENLTDGTGYTGRYMVDFDAKYVSGEGLTFELTKGIVTKSGQLSTPFVSGEIPLFTIGSGGTVTAGTTTLEQAISGSAWTHIKYILDMDLGTAEISVGGSDPVTVKVDNYQSVTTPDIDTLKYFVLNGGKSKSFNISMSNLTVAKLKDQKLPTKTVTVASNDAAKGTASVSGADSTGVALGYDKNTGKAAVKADKAMTVYLIEAKYTSNALTEAIPTKLEFTAAGTKEVENITAGSKLMVWKTLDGVEPVTDAITANETVELPSDNSVTETLNTLVTVKAVANEGNVFVNWTDGEGNAVSTDAEYTFRLRDDIALTANFAKQQDASDTASFKVKGDKALVKAGTEQTVTVEEYDVFDDAGNPVKYNASDVSWTVDSAAQTDGVTITGGVVTIPAAYTIGTNTTKTITVTATINEIPMTYKITVFSYLYYEDFESLTTSELLSAAGWTGATGDGAVIEPKTESGNTYVNYTAGSKSRSGKRNFASDNSLIKAASGNTVIEFNMNLAKPNTESNEICIYGQTPSFNNDIQDYGPSGNYLFMISSDQGKTNPGATITTTTTEEGTVKNSSVALTGFPHSTWVNVVAKCNFTDHTVAVTIKSLDGATEYYSGTVNMVDTAATGIQGIYYRCGRVNGNMRFDNIKIYAE